MDIDLREPVQLGESTQWIRIRATNARNPLLLLVQMGPGLPMINEAPAFGRALSLEDDFTVVYWDQRGCGRSLRSADVTRELSLPAMVGDTERLLALLCDRFGGPAVVAGFSMGATIAALATARRPDLVAALVTVGMDIDGPAIENSAYQFALATARARNNRRAIRQLEAIGPPPHLEPRQFATRARWAANFGGVRTGHTHSSMARGLLVSLLRSPDYSLADTVRAIRGITAARAALLPELAALDLPHTLTRLTTPIVMAQGRHDRVAPSSAAERYAESLRAPHKQLVWFEHSAHLPHLEEPERFRQLLAQVRPGLPARA
jgi:pimeloyl-ACP methyl ester carboxylesterase